MKRIRENRFIQALVFVLLAASLGIFTSKLDTLQFLLESGRSRITASGIEITALVSNVRTARTLGILAWGVAMGLYINHTYSLNSKKKKP